MCWIFNKKDRDLGQGVKYDRKRDGECLAANLFFDTHIL